MQGKWEGVPDGWAVGREKVVAEGGELGCAGREGQRQSKESRRGGSIELSIPYYLIYLHTLIYFWFKTDNGSLHRHRSYDVQAVEDGG